MQAGAITGYIDVAQIVLYMFWAFFACLLFYLRREDRREGYPLVSNGRPMNHGVFMPEPKSFRLANGTIVKAPSGKIDGRQLQAKPLESWSGAPLEPIGNQMLSEFGPGAYAERSDTVDVTMHGTQRLAPLRVAGDFRVAEADSDPRGMDVIGADGKLAGTVSDLWVDRAETLVRYLEVEIGTDLEPRRVLLPINFSKIEASRRRVRVNAILAHQFTDVPALKDWDQVTLLEEEKICAYYGGGTLYATPLTKGAHAVSDFDVEPVPGLPENLPRGEKILWQGAPTWRVLAHEAFHVRKVAIYFAVLLVWSVTSALMEGQTMLALSAFLWLVGFAGASIGILLLLAWGTARTTVYTITNRRVVMRFGIALPMTVNLPFKVIGAAALKRNVDGTGDIPLHLTGRDRVAWLVMWPHARPWRVTHPEPMLRAIGNVERVGLLLADAMQAALPAPPVETKTADARPLVLVRTDGGRAIDGQIGGDAALVS